jgi:hypothetical protein
MYQMSSKYFPMESVITRTLFVSRRATEIKSNIID